MAKKKNKQALVQKQQSAPVATGNKKGLQKQPTIVNKSDGSTIITHTEFCFDIACVGNPNANVYPVNPQRAVVFTWLSAIATRYEMYRFRKLRFTYKPSCSTSTSGYVVLAFDFDTYDQEYGVASSLGPSKAELLAWKYSSKCSLWQSTTLDVSVDSKIATFRYCDYSARGDSRLDLLGNLVVRTDSEVATAAGELFVEYTVEFRQPSYKVPPALYYTLEGKTMTSPSTYFNNPSYITGNLSIKVAGERQLRIEDVGKFYITMFIEGTGTMSGEPTMTFTVPSDSPSSEFVAVQAGALNTTTRSITSVILDVVSAPILLTAAIMGGGTLMKPVIRFATYK